MTGGPVLEMRDITVRHGGLVALDEVSLSVAPGEIVGLIGPNGAGKTTFIDTVTGFKAAAIGNLLYRGEDISHHSPHRRSRAGLARTFQSLELFDELSVSDNLAVAARVPTVWSTLTDPLWRKSRDDADVVRTLELLDLAAVAHRLPSELSNGLRHRVALARALVSSPTLLLLDEPAAGLDTVETDELAEVLCRLPALGITVVVVDHDMALIMGVCDTVHVLDFGRLVASGPPAAVRADARVVAAYLGGEA